MVNLSACETEVLFSGKNEIYLLMLSNNNFEQSFLKSGSLIQHFLLTNELTVEPQIGILLF